MVGALRAIWAVLVQRPRLRLSFIFTRCVLTRVIPGIPVATVAIAGAKNAALLAAQILGIQDEVIAEKLEKFKTEMAEKVRAKDKELQKKMKDL